VHSQPPAVEQTVSLTAPTKADYGWLVKALLGRLDQLKNYPQMARINHWEGKVILRAVIKDDGQVLMIDVHESSGRSILDDDAIETLRRASPLKLDHPLGKPQVAILMPISYALR
jgi:protein TonB